MANPASPDDVAARWRPLTDNEREIAAVLLNDAWSLLTSRVSDINDRLEADPATLDSNLVVMVLVEMVKRVLRNPNGLRSESIQDYSFTRDGDGSPGSLFVTDAELDLLTPATSGAAFSIRAYGRRGHSCCYDDCCC